MNTEQPNEPLDPYPILTCSICSEQIPSCYLRRMPHPFPPCDDKREMIHVCRACFDRGAEFVTYRKPKPLVPKPLFLITTGIDPSRVPSFPEPAPDLETVTDHDWPAKFTAWASRKANWYGLTVIEFFSEALK